MRKVLIEKVGSTTRVTTWDTKNPDKKVIKSYNQGANTLIEKNVLIIEDSNNVFPKQRILFSELVENYGTTDIKTFGEYLDVNGFFLVSGESSGGTASPIVVTRTEILVLVSSNSLSVGAQYTITDADINLYGGTEITLTAITENQLSLQGSGKFYCPKYDVSAESTGYGIWTKQMEGTFSGIVGTFTPNVVVTANNGATAKYLAQGFLEWISGNWSAATSISGATATANVSGFVSPSYTVGQIVHWGGKSWTNVNGNIGASIDKYTLNAEWQVIPFNETAYNVYIDEIHYDFGNDMIIYRKDRYNNVVSGSNQVFVELESPDGLGYGNPIKDFQWGCMQDDFNTDDYFSLGIQCNEVIDSYFETLNTRGKHIWFNKLSKLSYINYNTLSSNSHIQYAILSNYSTIRNNTLSDSGINNITFGKNSGIYNNTLSNSNIYNSTLSDNSNINNITLSDDSSINNNTLMGSSIENSTFSNSSIISNILSTGQLTFSNKIISKTVIYLEIRNSYVSIPNTATIIFNPSLSKTIFTRLDGTPRLQYVNNSDVIVITDVDA